MKKRKVKLFASIASLGLVVAVMGVGVWAATQQAVKVSSQVSFVATSVAADITLQVHNKAGATANGVDDIVEKASMADPTEQGAAYKYYDAKTLTNAGATGVEQYVGRFVNDTAKTVYENRVYLKVADKDEDGYLNVGAQIVYEFIIKAHTSSAPIYYEVHANLLNTEIPGTDYTLDQVFDVTVTDTYLHETADDNFSKTATTVTNTETGAFVSKQTMITNWTAGTTETIEDTNAIQPDITGDSTGKQKATTPSNLSSPEGAIVHTYGEERRITVTYTVKDLAESDPTNFAGYQGIAYTMSSLQLGDIYIKVANNGNNLNGLPAFGEDIVDNSKVDKKVDWAQPKDTTFDGTVLPDAPSQES